MKTYRAIDATLALTTQDTEYAFRIGEGMAEVAWRLTDDTTTWRWSAKSGVVAGGGGFPLEAGETLAFSGPMVAQTLYFAADVDAQTLNFSAQSPVVR